MILILQIAAGIILAKLVMNVLTDIALFILKKQLNKKRRKKIS